LDQHFEGVARGLGETFSLTFSDKENGRQRTTTLTFVPLSSAVWGRLDIFCFFRCFSIGCWQPIPLRTGALPAAFALAAAARRSVRCDAPAEDIAQSLPTATDSLHPAYLSEIKKVQHKSGSVCKKEV
jgi:hypothetical protein